MILETLIQQADPSDRILLRRAVDTLQGNILPLDPDGTFGNCRAIVPSPATYKGVWNWDSAFHLMAMSHIDPVIGRDQIRILFSHMRDDGQLPDVIFADGREVFRFTKPPVLADAIVYADRVAPDDEFLRYAYPYLIRNLHWWETARYDGTLFGYKVHKMESGWDNTPRFDFPNRIDKCYAIDCNCFMYGFYRSLGYIARRLHDDAAAAQYLQDADALAEKINRLLYDRDNGYYCDYNKKRKRFTAKVSPASFLPLYYGFADQSQADAMHKLAASKDWFYDGIPTIAYNNRAFSANGYWRGPCWLNTAYFTVRGLLRYGYSDTALALTNRVLSFCRQNTDSIYEYYNPITGKGLGAKNFGWSCAFVLELLGLQYDMPSDTP